MRAEQQVERRGVFVLVERMLEGSAACLTDMEDVQGRPWITDVAGQCATAETGNACRRRGC